MTRISATPDPGDVVTVEFVGATGTKRRPAVVVSSTLYHANRPDLILVAVTTRVADATAPTDYLLQDWTAAGLRRPSAVRVYFNMALPAEIRGIGHLSERDWQEVQARLALALTLSTTNAAS